MITIACTCDGSYAPHTGTMLRSLIDTNRAHRFEIVVLFNALPPPDRAKLTEVVGSAGSVRFVEVPEVALAHFPQEQFHRSCWMRILLPGLLPQCTKILYLDSDIIVREDIGLLWDTNITEHLFAAAQNPLYPFMPPFPVERLGLPNVREYLNSGVLLMNLDRMRREHLTERVVHYAREHPENLYPEQDALNALFHNRYLRLHPRWNVQSTYYDVPGRKLCVDPEAIREALERPAILHFIGPFKPWFYLCKHPLRHLYFQARALTPWPNKPPAGRDVRAILMRPLPLAWRYHLHRLKHAIRGMTRMLRPLGHSAP